MSPKTASIFDTGEYHAHLERKDQITLVSTAGLRSATPIWVDELKGAPLALSGLLVFVAYAREPVDDERVFAGRDGGFWLRCRDVA